jgi:serine/threonine protein kinase
VAEDTGMTEPVEIDIRALGPLRKIGSGGQGTVYELRGENERLVYKEYSPRVVDDVDVDALIRFVRFGRELNNRDRRLLTSRAAWPLNVVRKDGVIQGFVMPRAPDTYSIEMTWPSGERSRVLGQVQFLLNGDDYLRDRELEITREFRLRFLQDTALTLALFHRLGITVGDLSPNNLLFTRSTAPKCFFIDCDAMRLGEDTVLEQVETPDWRVAELGEENLATPASDSHKFGLLTIRLFAGDQHSRSPMAVPKRLRRLTIRCLSADPDRRPAAGDWPLPIENALKHLPPPRPPQPSPRPPVTPPAWLVEKPLKPPPRQPRTRQNRGRVIAPVVAAAAFLVFLFIVNVNGSSTSPNSLVGARPASAPPPPLVFSYPSLPLITFSPPSFVVPTPPQLTCMALTGYGSGVAENPKMMAAVEDFVCALNYKGIDAIPGTKDATFTTRFQDLQAGAPYHGRTVTGVTKGANGTLRVTFRFEGTTSCLRSTLTLTPLDGGYAVSGFTVPTATTGCG